MEMDKWEYMDEYMSKKFDKEMLSFDIIDKQNSELSYLIRVQKDKDILINVRTRNETELTKEYEKEFSLKDIKENFNKYNSIVECRKDIISNIENCTISRDFKSLSLEIPLKNGKYPTISFVLDEREREVRALKYEAGIIIEYLNKENKELKSKIAFLEENGNLNVKVKRKDLIKQYTFKYGDKLNTLVKKFRESEKNLERCVNLLYEYHIIINKEQNFLDYEILNNSTIEILDFKNPKCGGFIYVKTTGGNILTIESYCFDTIKTIKSRIQDKEGIPINQQILIYEGTLLYDNVTIEEYNIERESTLHLVVRLR